MLHDLPKKGRGESKRGRTKGRRGRRGVEERINWLTEVGPKDEIGERGGTGDWLVELFFRYEMDECAGKVGGWLVKSLSCSLDLFLEGRPDVCVGHTANVSGPLS